MASTIPHSLTLAQKVRLAVSVFAIYWPIRLYINVDRWSWHTFEYVWVPWLLEIPLTILFLTGWLSVTGWLEGRFSRGTGYDFLIDVKWPAQLVNLLIAGAMAVMFNVGFRYLLFQMDTAFNRHEGRAAVASVRPAPERQKPEPPRPFERSRREKANNGLMVLAMIMAYYLAANRRGYQELAQLRVNAEQLKREATQAQFVALRNQVNPHFLFNSLSILASLVEVDPRLSVRFIKQLSKVYRYILEQRDTERVSLKTELDFLEAYGFLLNIRFEGKLQILNKVDGQEAIRYTIAPLTLQLLVENAVKHNQMSVENPLVVTIETAEDYLLVWNPLQRRPQVDDSTGMGLENIRNRYALLTDRPLSAREEDDRFIIKIPLLGTEQKG